MLRFLVLSLTASYALCLKVTPDMLLPMKSFGESCGYDACPVPLSEDGINVHIVPHTHYELAFERTFAEHYSGKNENHMPSKVSMKQTLDSVVTELYMQPHRRFALADMPYFFHWWSQRDDTVRQMVYSLVRQGRLVFVGGGWSMIDEATTNYHAIIDSHTFSLRKINATFYKCGRPLVAWQSDVMGHSREFTSLAAQMGYDALFINPISFDDELSRMRRWALEMLWRGSDDLGLRSDIFTHKLFDGYWSPPGFCFSSLCEDPLIVKSDSVMSNVEERVKSFVDSIYNRQAPNYNTSHVMVMMGHVNGYYDAPMWFANIDALINAVNARAKFGKPKMYLFYSTPACYAKAVHDANIPLETKQDDFFPIAYDKNSYLTGLYTSCPSIKLMAKEALVYLQMCKQMKVLAELGPEHNKLFEELNWIVGAFHDHTIITGAMKDTVKSYYIEKMYIAVQRSTVLLREAWNKLRKSPSETIYYRCSFNISRCHILIGDTYFVQIYNPLAWPVTVPVRVPMVTFGEDFSVFDPAGKKVKTATLKIPYPVLNLHERVNASNCEVVFIAENLPPIGFRSYFIQRNLPEEPTTEQPRIERGASRIKRDSSSIRPKRRLIKHMKRKPNKKYLIRQTNPQFEDQTLLDIDYEYDGSTVNPVNEIGNVSVLLESDGDELTMQHLSEAEEESSTKISENITQTTTPKHPPPPMRAFPATTETIVDKVEPQHWNKVVMTGKKNLDDIILGMKPRRTTTLKYTIEPSEATTLKSVEQDIATEPEVKIKNRTMKQQLEETTDKEGLRDIVESLLEHIKMTTEGEVSEEAEVTEVPITTKTTIEASVEPPIEITTSKGIIKTTTQKAITEEQRRQYQAALKKDIQRKFFDFGNVNNSYIENKYIRVTIDPTTSKISAVTLSNGVHIDLDIQFYFYASDDPDALNKTGFKRPGAYLFRAMENTAIPILDFIDVQVFKTEVVEEAHLVYSDWTSFVIRVYEENPVIEIEWLVGPVPVADKLGKEVFIRYLTNLVHDGIFYTDSNGRQTMKRVRNLRPMFEPLNLDQVAGNFYPVTSRISIQDLNSRVCFSVFTDRAQGGASLSDGEIDLMLHRRILTDDTGAGTFVNETAFGKGVAVRGKHYLYISKIDHKPYRIFEKKFAKEIQLGPQVLISRPDPYGAQAKQTWSNSKNEMSFLKTKLPIGVHILTIEHWNDYTLLLRLENYLERSDTLRNPIKTVFIRELFTNIYINNVKETTLGANIWLEDHKPWKWNKNEDFVKNFNGFYGVDKEVEFLKDEQPVPFEHVDLDKGITLDPQQIRTFVCWFDYVET